ALMPYTPAAAKAFRSAWTPAPPLESEPAIVKHLGTTALPSPVRTGSGSTGVISAPEGTPERQGYHRRMAISVARWDDLLAGEELAYLGTEAAREPRLAPLPDELHPRVREALEARGVDALYAHQAAAWEAARRGEHLVVTTGTASGKTLAFNLPVLD